MMTIMSLLKVGKKKKKRTINTNSNKIKINFHSSLYSNRYEYSKSRFLNVHKLLRIKKKAVYLL